MARIAVDKLHRYAWKDNEILAQTIAKLQRCFNLSAGIRSLALECPSR